MHTLTVPRYRPKQKLQEVKESTFSLDYLINQGLNPVRGCFEVETLTLDCLVNVATLKGFSIESSKVHEYYSRLHNILSNVGSPLQPKKVKQIEGKLQCIRKVAKGFEALYKKQVELKWFQVDKPSESSNKPIHDVCHIVFSQLISPS